MKRIFKKNQIIITTLAIMIAIAGYLNYSGRLLEQEVKNASSDDNVLLVTDDLSAAANTYDTYEDIPSMDHDYTDTADASNVPSDAGSGIGEAVLASTDATSDFLAAAKLNREQVRAKNKETLLEVINNTELAEEQKSTAVSAMTQMAENADKEAAAELLLEAKGFEGCVVSITDGSADVVIKKDALDDAERAQIEDIVKRKTEISGDKIVISPETEETP